MRYKQKAIKSRMCTTVEKVNPQFSISLCSHPYLPPLPAKELLSGIEKISKCCNQEKIPGVFTEN